ncbi:MAG: efflux RND transporter periplasmic adaptor subunit [Gemmatimonadetes bacterium]|nr:efflux RND transporter periplasmic adaptor subunit [Gemmatimonadota bacterium]
MGTALRNALTCLLLLSVLAFTACSRGDATADPDQAKSAAADSTVADSAAVAKSDSGKQKKGGGFLQKIFKRGDDDEEKEEPPVPVELTDVSRRDVPYYVAATATLEAEKRATILAKIAGEIREIRVEEGDYVKEGQLLARTDGRAQAVALEESRARLRGLELDFERVTTLFEQDLVSTKEMNDARARYEEATAQLKASELNHSYTYIRAPFSGTISLRSIDPGQNVQVGTELFSIVDFDPLLARVHLPEHVAASIALGQRVVITPDTGDTLTYEGKVMLVSPVVDTRTGTVKVTCMIDGNNELLKPGSFVRVKLQTDMHPDVLVVPTNAIVAEGDESYVYRAQADTVVKVLVATGYTDDLFIEVSDGVSEGDRIVTVGQGALRAGAKFEDIHAKKAEEEGVADSDSAGADGEGADGEEADGEGADGEEADGEEADGEEADGEDGREVAGSTTNGNG